MPVHPKIEGVLSRLLLVAVVATCLGLTACGGDDEQSQAEAAQELCRSLDTFAASVVSLQGLSIRTSTQDDVEAAVDNIEEAWDRVVEDANDVKDVSTGEIRSAYDDLKRAVENRPTDEPIAQVIAGLEPEVTAFTRAWKEFVEGLSCATA